MMENFQVHIENSGRKKRHKHDKDTDDDHHEKKKHKKSKKSSKHKHKDKDKDRDREKTSQKDRGKHKGSISVAEPELTAIEKFNMFKKQREAAKHDEGKVVDDLFKDFIASKIKQIESESDKIANKERKSKSRSKKDKLNDSVNEISRYLDEEISNIEIPKEEDKAEEEEPSHLVEDSKKLGSMLVHSKKDSHYKEPLKEAKYSSDFTVERSKSSNMKVTVESVREFTLPSKEQKHKDQTDIPLPSTCQTLPVLDSIPLPIPANTKSTSIPKLSNEPLIYEMKESLEDDGNALPVFGPLLPPGVMGIPKKEEPAKIDVKKPTLGFKNFGIKLSASSAELIQSGELHKKGKRLEDGEVVSSSSEAEGMESSESECEISGTGSISDGKVFRGKKKKKSKHKKKKGKEKDDLLTVPGKDISASKRKSSHTHSRSTSPKKSRRSRSRSKDRSRRRSRSRDKRSKRSRSKGRRSRSRSRRSLSRSRRRSCSRSRRRSHSKSRTKRSRSRDRRSRSRGRKSLSRSPDRFWRSKYGDFDAFKFLKSDRVDRSRSRSPDRERDRFIDKERRRMEDLRLKIDKAKLREIAIQNALTNAKMGGAKLDVTVKAGGKSVEELTEYCKKIQEKEFTRRKYRHDSSSDEGAGMRSDDEDFHHPFKVKEAGPIVMDIPNAKPLPVVTPQERLVQNAQLRLTFPVSSGSQHRDKEWVPVEPEAKEKLALPPSQASPLAIMPPPPKPEVKVFEEPIQESVDIGAIVSERLNAVRKLQENPHDVSAKMVLNQAQKQASQWAQSKNLPGQFIGSTGVNILTPEELAGDKRRQAWLKKWREMVKRRTLV
ncbi:protein Son-like isoform X2 [Mya arenaria]|uniref:protein Son-like isoform X2 n=1 Tax=Mya arenaria TaxID=6604 RepID=UPI0022E05E73|nr:protein Son-like isoform X2 [Mya arenaria]XP_052808861.1 protein Son-like isoform X2 [Mya arenaria]